MKVYIIYKIKDNLIVKKQLKKLKEHCHSAELLLLPKNTRGYWKNYAYKKIKEADCAIFFVSKEAYKSGNIRWELKKFIKLNKPIYTILLDDESIYPKVLFKKNTFGNIETAKNNKLMISKNVGFKELVNILNNKLELNVVEEIIANKNMDSQISIEQYKAYLQTSENVVARRQNVSNFYVTVNSIIISILSTVTTLINLLVEKYTFLIIIMSCYFIAMVGLILCFNWYRLVSSYGKLNSAKMIVISAIEKSLPYDIYDVEWKVQNDRLGKRKYVPFTKIEKVIPLLFGIIYSIILVAAVVLTIIFLV